MDRQFQRSAQAESKPKTTVSHPQLLQSLCGERKSSPPSERVAPPPVLHEALSLPVQPSYGPIIQPKLTIGPVGDKYEQEADRIASQVVNQMNAPQANGQHEAIQRQEQDEDAKLQRQPLLQLQPLAGNGAAASPQLESEIGQARSGGQPLAFHVRGAMEQAFGADFSGVRVHADAQADRMNRSISAIAFTNKQDVFFRQGAYQPESRRGQELIAHELTHVVQQSGAMVKQQGQPIVANKNSRSAKEPELRADESNLGRSVCPAQPEQMKRMGTWGQQENDKNNDHQEQKEPELRNGNRVTENLSSATVQRMINGLSDTSYFESQEWYKNLNKKQQAGLEKWLGDSKDHTLQEFFDTQKLGKKESDEEKWSHTMRSGLKEVRGKSMSNIKDTNNAVLGSKRLANFAHKWMTESIEHFMSKKNLGSFPDFIIMSLGSFARREMAPYSDADFVVICRRKGDIDSLKPLIKAWITEHKKEIAHLLLGDQPRGGINVDEAADGNIQTPETFKTKFGREGSLLFYSTRRAITIYWDVKDNRANETDGGEILNRIRVLIKQTMEKTLTRRGNGSLGVDNEGLWTKNDVIAPVSQLLSLVNEYEQRKIGDLEVGATSTAERIEKWIKDKTIKNNLLFHYNYFLRLRWEQHLDVGEEHDLIEKNDTKKKNPKGTKWKDVRAAYMQFTEDLSKYCQYLLKWCDMEQEKR